MKKISLFPVFISVLTLNGCFILMPVDRSKYSDIEGHVFSVDTNSSVNAANIFVTESSSSENTDVNGSYLVKGLPVGWVNVEIKAPGYPVLKRKLKVEPHGTKHIDFWLSKNEIEGDKIVFERDGDIWLTDEYGVNQENLTEKIKDNMVSDYTSGYRFTSPVWFANKKKISYLLLDNSVLPGTKNGIWMMNPNGKMNQRLTYIDSSAKGLTVSSNGNNFIFSMIDPDNASNTGIYKYNRTLGKIESFSAYVSREFSPKYSPDSSTIAFTSYITENPQITNFDSNQFVSSRMQIFIMNSNGQSRKQITKSGDNYDPAWSPDGQKIAFISNRSGFSELWVMNKDGSGQRRLTETGASRANSPVWSADGEKILFNSNHKQHYSSITAMETWVFEPSTYQLRMLSNDVENPDW